MAPPRDFKAEYRDRVARARARGLPTNVARGHGPVPIKVAEALEKQRSGAKPLPIKAQEKYRKGIAQYEKRQFGGLLNARVVGVKRQGRLVPRYFKTREDAEHYVEHEKGVPLHYATFQQGADGRWTATTLR